MKKFISLILLIAFAILPGCFNSRNVQVTRDASYNGRVSKMLVIMQFPKPWYKKTHTEIDPKSKQSVVKEESDEEAAERCRNEFRNRLSAHLADSSIVNDFCFTSGLELNNDDIAKKIKKFAPDTLLIIDIADEDGNWRRLLSQGYDMRLINTEQGKCFWRSNAVFARRIGFTDGETMADVMFEDLVTHAKPKEGPGWFKIPEKK